MQVDDYFNQIKEEYYNLVEKNESYKLKRWEKKRLKEVRKKVEEIQKIKEAEKIGKIIIKEKINNEKKNNPEKFIEIKEATKEENENNELFCLGLLAQNLEQIGITSAIDKNNSNNLIDENFCHFMTSGLIEKKKYNFHFDFGETKNEELLNDTEKQKKFNEKLRKKLSKDYNISEDNIIIASPERGSYQIPVIFITENFDDNFDEKNFINKFNNDNEFKDLCYLKEVHKDIVACKLPIKMFDKKGNKNEFSTNKNKKRGNMRYIPPVGWKGYGLNVIGIYENDNWLKNDGNFGEWCVAYLGIGEELNFENDEKCDGVYCIKNPKVMEEFLSKNPLIINGKKYIMGLMVRVKPDKIKEVDDKKDYYFVSGGTQNEMRPYRVLIKEID